VYPQAVRAREDAAVRAACLNWTTPAGRAFRTWRAFDSKAAAAGAREAEAAAAAAEREAGELPEWR
jgi:hypothetical protein